MLLTDDDDVADHARLKRWHGVTRSIWERHRGGTESYGVSELGFNYRIDDPRAAIGRSRLGRLDDDNRKRAAIESVYREELGELDGLSMLAAAAGVGSDQQQHVRRGRRRRGGSRRLPRLTRGARDPDLGPLLSGAPLRALRRLGAELPVADAFAARTVSLPMFPEMEEGQQAQVIEAVRQALS